MKLGLLVVLAVAVLVPSLSEGRIVSRCELKKKLGEKLVLPERFEDTILKVVICNLKRRTHLQTDKIRVHGHPRKTTTTTKPVTTKPVTTTPVPTRPVTTTPVPTKPVTTTPVPTKPVTTTPVPTRPVTTTPVTARPVTTKATATESAAAKLTTTESMATNSVATSSTTARATRTTSNQTTSVPGNKRRKREADATSEESDSMNTGGSLEDVLNEEQVKFDEEQLWQDDNRMDDEDNENDEDVEDGEKIKKRSLLRGKGKGRKMKQWSLGYYGIFELTDSHFCDSGYRWSRNVCNTSCSAFTDEDISDDCDCAVKTLYWLSLYWSAPRWCHRVSVKRFFAGCD